jgi:hypothetical protein
VNRRQRRANIRREARSAKQILELQHRVEHTRRPGRIHGLTDACRDCHATGSLILLPGRRVVDWKPVRP